MSNRYTALLPLKFNSDRIPGKNFKNLNGRPLFEWMLSKLIECQQIDRVVINTDAVDYLKQFAIVNDDKVMLRARKEEICGDFVSMNLVINDDLEALGEGHYLMTHSTNPLISVDTINKALVQYELKSTEGYDSLFTCNEFKSRFYDEDINPINHDPDNLIRTQDLPSLYEENSCLYIFSKKSFNETGARIGKKPTLFATPKLESIDIDEEVDWIQAEYTFKLVEKQK